MLCVSGCRVVTSPDEDDTQRSKASRAADPVGAGSVGSPVVAQDATPTPVPASLQGTWARTPADCSRRNRDRFILTDAALNLFEGGGPVRRIERDGSSTILTYVRVGASEGGGPHRLTVRPQPKDGLAVQQDGGGSRTFVRCLSDTSRANTAAPQASPAGSAQPSSPAAIVPVRFRGRFAPDARACAPDFSYAPAFQTVTVREGDVSFFETGGPVTNVAVQGDNAAITLVERVGDSRTTRAIYLALEGDGRVRYRPDLSRPSRHFVRCRR